MNAPSPARLIVTYLSRRDSAWRCLLHTLTHRWQSIVIMVAPPVLLPALHWLQDRVEGQPPSLGHFIWFPCIYFPIYALVTWVTMVKRFPAKGPPRIFTSSFHDEGFRDVGPGSNRFVPWSQIKSIGENRGDIHIWYGFAGACYVPADAFPDQNAAREFHRAAVTLWNEHRASRHQPA